MRDVEVDSARLDWASGPERLRRVRRGLDDKRLASVDTASRRLEAELMRRTGPDFRLADLARLYADAERWAPGILEGAFRGFVLPQAETPLLDAAFHHHSRLARDARDEL